MTMKHVLNLNNQMIQLVTNLIWIWLMENLEVYCNSYSGKTTEIMCWRTMKKCSKRVQLQVYLTAQSGHLPIPYQIFGPVLEGHSWPTQTTLSVKPGVLELRPKTRFLLGKELILRLIRELTV